MPLYFIRHGETDYNKTFKIQGLMDNTLNETGRLQAKEVANKLKDIPVDAIISSNLKRADETANIINTFHDVERIYDDLVIERNFGELEGTCAKEYHNIVDFSIYKNYEQDDVIKQRVRDFLNNLDDRTYIIVSHSHFIKSLISLYDENFNYHSALPNCSIVKIDNGEYEIL